jgi:hypothetical protein
VFSFTLPLVDMAEPGGGTDSERTVHGGGNRRLVAVS